MMTKLVSLSEDVYEELVRIKKREGKSFSEVIRDLLRYRYADINRIVELSKQLGPFEFDEVDKKVWDSIPKRAEKIWKSA